MQIKVNSNTLARLLAAAWQSYRLGFLVALVGLLLTLLTPHFLTIDNLYNVLTNVSLVAIVGLGMTLAIASGNFDLSVGSTAALAGCISMSLIVNNDWSVPPAILVGLVSGALIGLGNGLIITELRVPAFIATLATMTILRGVALIYTNGRDIYLSGKTDYKFLSGGRLLGIPVPIVLMLALTIILILVVKQTRFGRQVLAVGSNKAAARRSGVRVSLVVWGVFAIVGVTAALYGMIISSQVLTANGRLDTGLELSAIAVVVLGGTPLSGGQINLIGTLLGSLLIETINNGLNLLNISSFYQQLTVGLLLLIALTLEVSRGYDLKNLLKVEKTSNEAA